jgi:hypothetical protein
LGDVRRDNEETLVCDLSEGDVLQGREGLGMSLVYGVWKVFKEDGVTLEELQSTIGELQKQVELKKKELEEERRKKREETKRQWKFTISKTKPFHDEIRDPAVVLYKLQGTVVNSEECVLAGWSSDEVRGGGMNYLFNIATGKFIKQEGGGNIYIPSASWARNAQEKEDAEKAFETLELFLKEFPEGGDVTYTIVSQSGFRWR